MDSRTRSPEARPSIPTAGARRRGEGPALGLTVLLAVMTAAAAACEAPEVGEEVEEEGTPAPPADLTDPLMPMQRDAALAYARQLEFAEGEEHHWAWDKQHLDVVETDAEGNRQVVRGPLGTIWPEVNSHANSEEDLQRGRILAKIEMDSAYQKLGLPRGVSYIWVDGRSPTGEGERTVQQERPEGGQEGTRYRAVVVPEDPNAEPDTLFVRYIPQERRLPLALARWRWSPDDENAWFSCAASGCCEARAM